MFLFGSKFSGLVPFVLVDLEDSDALSDVAGCSLVTVISRLFGNDAIVFSCAWELGTRGHVSHSGFI